MTCWAAFWSDQRSGDAACLSSSFSRVCLPAASKTHQQGRDAGGKALERCAQLVGRHGHRLAAILTKAGAAPRCCPSGNNDAVVIYWAHVVGSFAMRFVPVQLAYRL